LDGERAETTGVFFTYSVDPAFLNYTLLGHNPPHHTSTAGFTYSIASTGIAHTLLEVIGADCVSTGRLGNTG
jgi:hypothetical protein